MPVRLTPPSATVQVPDSRFVDKSWVRLSVTAMPSSAAPLHLPDRFKGSGSVLPQAATAKSIAPTSRERPVPSRRKRLIMAGQPCRLSGSSPPETRAQIAARVNGVLQIARGAGEALRRLTRTARRGVESPEGGRRPPEAISGRFRGASGNLRLTEGRPGGPMERARVGQLARGVFVSRMARPSIGSLDVTSTGSE